MLCIEIERAGELQVECVANGELLVLAGARMLFERQQVAPGRLAVGGLDSTEATGEEARKGGLVVHALTVVEGHHHAQLSIVAEQ